jgi:hypothetical protein
VLLCWSQNSYGAENLECPEIGAASVPDLTGDASGGGLFVSENRVDLANEINEAINRLQIASPDISWSDAQNVLVAAYCRVVARKGGLTAAEKWAACASAGFVGLDLMLPGGRAAQSLCPNKRPPARSS